MRKIAVILALLCSFFTEAVSAASLILEYDGSVHNYNGAVYELEINGKLLTNLPLEPIIFNDRALVPVREVFEGLGAEVLYNDTDKSIDISYGETTVELQIDSTEAKINGNQETITDNVAPKLIAKWGESAKTMVPARFISEKVGLYVLFDESKGLIRISETPIKPSPNPSQAPEIPDTLAFNNIEYNEDRGVVRITVSANGTISDMKDAIKTEAGVIYTDVYGVECLLENKYDINMSAVKAVRFGMHDEFTRIAVDTENIAKYSISLSADAKSVVIMVAEIGASNITLEDIYIPVPEETESPSEPSQGIITIPNGSPKPITFASEKLVVLDVGHGGRDPGAIGSLMNEQELAAYHAAVASTEIILPTMKPGSGQTYYEKDIALSVAHKVRENLEANGIKVLMTRTGDTYPELDARPALANAYGAVIFVSIHLNSTTADVTAAHGIEVFYSEHNNDNYLNLSSKQLASFVLDRVIDSTNAKSRGVKTGNLLVNRECMMPSALIEIGFMSNPVELEKMASNWYQDQLAAGISQGIIESWRKVVIP